MEVQVKDIIRAYDFKPMLGRTDSFVEGEVLDINNVVNGYLAYKIRVTKDLFDGRVFTEVGYKHLGNRVGEIVFVPHKIYKRDYAGRIMNLSR